MKSLSNAEGSAVLADRIRLARRFAKLSQAELAGRLDVAPSAVAQWESPHGTRPRIEKFSALAAAMGVPVDWLLTGRGNRSRARPVDDHTPAITPDSFARDDDEELLLKQFRRLPTRRRNVFMQLLAEFDSRR